VRVTTIAVLLGSLLAVASAPAASGTRPQSLILFNAALDVETAFGVVSADRKGRRMLSHAYSAVAWSPNGRRILAYGGPTGLAILDDRARLVRALPMTHGFFINVTWSPDGRWIAGLVSRCPYMQPFCSDLRILSVDGREDRLLSDAGVLDLGRGMEFDWAPDSRRIVYSGSPTSALEGTPTYEGLVIVSITGAKVTSPTFRGAAEPNWSPSGRKIAFSRDHNLYSVRVDGTQLTLLKRGNDWFEPSWSPDGRRIVYRQSGIYVLDVARRRAVRVDVGWPAVWSPTGARLAGSGFYRGMDYVFVARADGRGKPRPLTPGGVADWR
jgi:Tol biopolymer transport system component